MDCIQALAGVKVCFPCNLRHFKDDFPTIYLFLNMYEYTLPNI